MSSPTRTRLVSRPFVLVTSATFAFFLYIGILVTVLPRFIEGELGGGEVAIGVSVAVFSLAAIAIRPVIGATGDRRGRRVLMVAGGLAATVAGVLTGFVDSVAMLMPLRALAGIGEAALFVGAATLIADLSPPDRRAEAASYFSVAVFGGIGLGPVLGEAVLGDDRYLATFLVASAFALTAAGLSLFVPDRVGTVATASGSSPRFHRAALVPGAVLAFGIAGLATFNAFIPLYTDSLGLSGAASVFLTYSIVCLVVRVVGARLPERLGLGRATAAALALLAAGLMIVGVTGTVPGLYLGTVVLALGISLLYPALLAMTVNSVPETERASVVSTFTMFFEIGTAVGGLVLGVVAELWGAGAAFVGGGLAAVAGLAVVRFVLLPHQQAVEARPAFEPASVSAGE